MRRGFADADAPSCRTRRRTRGFVGPRSPDSLAALRAAARHRLRAPRRPRTAGRGPSRRNASRPGRFGGRRAALDGRLDAGFVRHRELRPRRLGLLGHGRSPAAHVGQAGSRHLAHHGFATGANRSALPGAHG
ncbi:MAG: hypothetical protein C0503_05080 [Gemmatimonas sp.]|nr:hypothetical protein [Gemmatimonas sp.]